MRLRPPELLSTLPIATSRVANRYLNADEVRALAAAKCSPLAATRHDCC
jgi:hypothetical protein